MAQSKSSAFHNGTDDIRSSGIQRQADKHSPGVGIPEGGTLSQKIGKIEKTVASRRGFCCPLIEVLVYVDMMLPGIVGFRLSQGIQKPFQRGTAGIDGGVEDIRDPADRTGLCDNRQIRGTGLLGAHKDKRGCA